MIKLNEDFTRRYGEDGDKGYLFIYLFIYLFFIYS